MKKFMVFIFLVCFFICTTHKAEAISTKEENNANILLQKVQKSQNVDDLNEALEYYRKLSNKYKEPMNVKALEVAVAANTDRYNTVQQKKYKANARKYAKWALENNTQDLNTIITAITLAAEDLDTEDMIKFYDYMCQINSKAGSAIKDVFTKQISDVNQAKTYNSSVKWANFNQLLYTYIQNRPTPRYSTTTGIIDANGFVNLNTMSY